MGFLKKMWTAIEKSYSRDKDPRRKTVNQAQRPEQESRAVPAGAEDEKGRPPVDKHGGP